MKLVWKETPRGRIERYLSISEKKSVLHVFSHSRKPSLAGTYVSQMSFLKRWTERNYG